MSWWSAEVIKLQVSSRWKKLAIGAFAVLVPCGAYPGFLQLTGNFHTVIAGELYRSAQPDAKEIADYKARYGIKTIINLRGENNQKDWYRQELAASRQFNIKHIDFRMSNRKVLGQAQAAKLIALMQKVEKPVLIHCAAGADRTGLAVALYLASRGYGEVAAESQLSFRYGHVGIPILSSSYAMNETFERLEPWLGFPHS